MGDNTNGTITITQQMVDDAMNNHGGVLQLALGRFRWPKGVAMPDGLQIRGMGCGVGGGDETRIDGLWGKQ